MPKQGDRHNKRLLRLFLHNRWRRGSLTSSLCCGLRGRAQGTPTRLFQPITLGNYGKKHPQLSRTLDLDKGDLVSLWRPEKKNKKNKMYIDVE